MFVNVIPAGALEFLLFLALAGAFGFVVLRVARRNTYLPDPLGIEEVAMLATTSRVTITFHRIFRGADLVLGDADVGEQRLAFCLADYSQNVEIYRSALKLPLAIAPYALAQLASIDDNGYMDAWILTETVDPVGLKLLHSGPRRNDYTLRGTISSVREGELDGDAVFIYSFVSADGALLDVATKPAAGATPFAEGDDVIGTARLYGYVPAADEAIEAATPLRPEEASQQ